MSAEASGARPAILALDPASRAGWAFRGADDSFDYGWKVFKTAKRSRDGDRLNAFRLWVRAMIADLRPGLVTFEGPGLYKSRDAVRLAWAFSTRTEEEAWLAGVEYREVPPCALKKHSTGNGNASKEMMVAEAASIYGLDAAALDDNAADALLLLAYAEAGFPEPEKKRPAPKRTAARAGKAGAE